MFFHSNLTPKINTAQIEQRYIPKPVKHWGREWLGKQDLVMSRTCALRFLSNQPRRAVLYKHTFLCDTKVV